MLGKMLYKDYWNKLFNDNNVYNQSKFYFKSTDVNRTIESIQSQLQGIFENIQPVNISNRDLINSLPAWNYTLDRDSGMNSFIKDLSLILLRLYTQCQFMSKKGLLVLGTKEIF